MIRLIKLLKEAQDEVKKSSSKILFIGDADTRTGQSYANSIMQETGAPGRIIAWKGMTTAQILRAVKRVDLQNYAVVTIMAPSAEPGKSKAAIRNLTDAFNIVKSAGVKLIAISNVSKSYLAPTDAGYKQDGYPDNEEIGIWVNNQSISDAVIDVNSLTPQYLRSDKLRLNMDGQSYVADRWKSAIKSMNVKLVPVSAAVDATKNMPGSQSDSSSTIKSKSSTAVTNPDYVTYDELVQLARGAGFDEAQSKIMAAIAKAESQGNANAVNDNPATGDLSYGLWQINMTGALGPDRRKKYKLDSNEDLFDPVTNARAARGVYLSQGYNAWSVYKNGSYKEYLESGKSSTEYTGKNGRLSASHLKSIGNGHMLDPKAAAAFIEMEKAAKQDGVTFDVTDSYRPYEVQDAKFDWERYNKTGERKKRGTNVAMALPGTSNHGWGKAIDVFPESAQEWVKQNGEKFGWSWDEGRSVGEPWHFTYVG